MVRGIEWFWGEFTFITVSICVGEYLANITVKCCDTHVVWQLFLDLKRRVSCLLNCCSRLELQFCEVCRWNLMILQKMFFVLMANNDQKISKTNLAYTFVVWPIANKEPESWRSYRCMSKDAYGCTDGLKV